MKQCIIITITILFTLCGCARQSSKSPHILEIRPASFEPVEGTDSFIIPSTGQTVYVHPTLLVTLHDIKSAWQGQDQMGHSAINISLTDHAGERLAQYTQHHIDEPIALLLDDHLLNAPIIRTKVSNHLQITGGSNGLTKDQEEAILKSVGFINRR